MCIRDSNTTYTGGAAPGAEGAGKKKKRTRRGGKSKGADGGAKTAAKAAATTATAKAVSTGEEGVKDDLKKVEGIGPKIEELLNGAGITSFAGLAATSSDKIKEILAAAGGRYASHEPTTWPKQADMAAKGEWEALEKWQDELDGGKVVDASANSEDCLLYTSPSPRDATLSRMPSSA